MNGEYTKAEILSQPTVWESTIEKVIKELERVSSTIDDPFTKNFIVLG